MAYKVMVGTTGNWYELPLGTEWLGWSQKRRSKMVKVPLNEGALDVGDGLWEALAVKLRVCLWSRNPGGPVGNLETQLADLYRKLMEYQSDMTGWDSFIAVEDHDPSSYSEFAIKYDRVIGMDVVFVGRTRHRHCYATFTLQCRTEPYMRQTQNTDGT